MKRPVRARYVEVAELNCEVAAKLRLAARLADLDEEDRAFRANAYRRAAETLEATRESVAQILARDGARGLTSLPGVGRSIAAAVAEMVETGRWRQLERMGGGDPRARLALVPGIGPELAHRIHDALAVDTLEELARAAQDGRLQDVPGFGPGRVAAVRTTLEDMLTVGRSPAGARRTMPVGHEPPVELLLAIDQEYRARAAAGELPTIAPRRFNPTGEAWLPLLTTRRGRWRFRVLYSNTARAHELGKSRDWVVVYFDDGVHPAGQRTVVTATRGAAAGRRVVRGREHEVRAQRAAA